MPERETPDHSSPELSEDLFTRLPAPSHRPPSVDQTPAAPGSRRARREAERSHAAQEPTTTDQGATSAHPVTEAFTTIPADGEGRTPIAAPAPSAKPTIDDLFAADSAEHAHAGERRKKRRTGCLIALVVLLVLIGGGVAGGFWVMSTYGDKVAEIMGWGEPADYEPGQETGEATVVINDGDTGSPVSSALYAAGVTKTESVFYDYLVDEGLNPTFYPGVYTLQQQMTAEAALAALENPANRMENTVNTLEGGTVATALATISESIGIPLEDLTAAVADPSAYGVEAATLEGWLFPATYTFDPDVTAAQVIQRMVDRTRESLNDAGVSAGDEERILTIASIIQREGHTADFDKVSRVIENRLDESNDQTHGMLQMDSTAQYGYGLTHEGPVSSWTWSEVIADDNAWNTYAHAGLPTSPISNPNHAAIVAAQNPASGPWFYFVTVNLDTGETVFSATYAEQQAAEATYRQWCEDNPDRGCY